MAKIAQSGAGTSGQTGSANSNLSRIMKQAKQKTTPSTQPAQTTQPAQSQVQAIQTAVRDRQAARTGLPTTPKPDLVAEAQAGRNAAIAQSQKANTPAKPNLVAEAQAGRNAAIAQSQQAAQQQAQQQTQQRTQEQMAAAQALRDEKTRNLLGETAGRSLMDLYTGAAGGEGKHWNDNLSNMRGQLLSLWGSSVQPAYQDYLQAMSDYEAGALDYNSAMAAYKRYQSAKSQYDPLQSAYESLQNINPMSLTDASSYEDAVKAMDLWDATLNAAEQNLMRMGQELDQMQKDYDIALAMYKHSQNKTNTERLNSLAESIQRLSGEYSASMFVYNEMAGGYESVYNLFPTIEARYYDENPWVLRSSDTPESVSRRAEDFTKDYDTRIAELDAEYDELQRTRLGAMTSDGPGGVDPTVDASTSPRMAAINQERAELEKNYQSMQWISRWATEENLASREEWVANGWTWAEQYALYKDAQDRANSTTDESMKALYQREADMYLDRITTGYGVLTTTPEESAELSAELHQRFDEIKGLFTIVNSQVRGPISHLGLTAEEQKQIEADYKDLQTRLHNLGQTATTASEVVNATAKKVFEDAKAFGVAVYDTTAEIFRDVSTIADHFGAYGVSGILTQGARALNAMTAPVKVEYFRASEALASTTIGMDPWARDLINLGPSFIEMLAAMGIAKMCAGVGALAMAGDSAAMAAQADAATYAMMYAPRLASATNTAQELVIMSEAALRSVAANPQFWTSYMHVLGTDYMEALNTLTPEINRKMAEYTKAHPGASEAEIKANVDLSDINRRALAYAYVDGAFNALIEVGGVTEHGGIQSMYSQQTLANENVRSMTLNMLLREGSLSEGMEEVYQSVFANSLQASMLGVDMPLISFSKDEFGNPEEAVFSFFGALKEFAGGAFLGGLVSSVRVAGLSADLASNIGAVNKFNSQLPAELRLESLNRFTATYEDVQNYSRWIEIQRLNALNLMLPEEIRLGSLDYKTATDEQVKDFIESVDFLFTLHYAEVSEEERKSIDGYLDNLLEGARQANPDVSILDTVGTELQEKGYGNAVEAQRQGELIGRVLSGDTLTDAEISAIELNNKLVREVFIERTGLTGMPITGNMNSNVRKTYIQAAIKLANTTKANQQAIAEGSTQLLEAQQAQAGQQLESTLQNEAGKKKRGGLLGFIDTRKENKNALNNPAGYADQVDEGHRKRPVITTGKSAEDIIAEVQKRADVPSLLTRKEFDAMSREALDDYAATMEAKGGLDNAYQDYLQSIGLTPAEVLAMVTASNIIEGSATNDTGRNETTGPELRRGTGGRELVNDEPGRAVPVSGAQGQSEGRQDRGKVKVGEWGSPEAVGIPGGLRDGSQVRELTGADIKNNPAFVNIVETAKSYGISPDHIHFIQSKSGWIELDAGGRTARVRGIHKGLTQELWIATNNPDYSASQIFGHELMHHICEVCPELVDQVRKLVEDAGLWPEIERHIKARSLKEYRSKGERGIFIEMLCDANGMMHRSYLQGDVDLAKQLRMATALYLCTAPDDMIAAAPEVREKMQLDAELFLKNTKQNPDMGIHYSAIDITSDRIGPHHDNLGRQLSKLMDKFMANSYMRTGLQKFRPLTTMYHGATMRREIMGTANPEEEPIFLAFWTDRPDIARTYSQGKGKSQLTHGQEHTKARQRIKELGMEYARIRRTNYTNLPEDQIEEARRQDRKRLKEIDKELAKLRAEVEPFSKDIYAPQKDRNVWPEKPETYEEAEALIKRFGAYNRKASLVKLDGNKLINDKAVPLFEEAKKQLARMVKFFEDYTAAQEEAGEEPDVEDVLGAPPWAEQEEPSNGLPAWANINIPGFFKPGHEPVKVSSDDQARNDIIAEANGILDEVESVQDTEDLNALYDAFDSLCGITDSLVTEFLIGYDERSDKAADIRSAYYKDTNKGSFRWSDVETMAAAIYNQVYSNTNQNIALDVKGLGVKKVFTSEQAVIEFAQDLVTQLGNKGIYSCYLNITKPLILDCRGLDWAILNMLNNKIVQQVAAWKVGAESVADMTASELATTDVGTDDIGMWASLQVDSKGNPKYDGVILQNIVDTHGIDNTFNFLGNAASTVAITWKANTVKSTANATPTDDPRISYSEEDIERSNTYEGREEGRSVSGDTEEWSNGVNDYGPDRSEQGQDRTGETGTGTGVSGTGAEILGAEEGQLPWEVIDEEEEDYEPPQVSDRWKDLDALSREVFDDSGYGFYTIGSSSDIGISNGVDDDTLWHVPLSVAKEYIPATVTDLLERANAAGFDILSKINFVWSYSDDHAIHIARDDGSISACQGCFDPNTGGIFVVLNRAIPKFASYNVAVQQTFIHELFHRMAYDLDGFVDNLLWNLNRRYDKEAESFKKLLERAKTNFRANIPSYSKLSSSQLSEEILAEIYSGSAAMIWSGEEELTSLYSTIEKFRQYIEGFADRNYGTHYSEEDEDQLAMYDVFPIDISAYDGFTTDSVSPLQRERALKYLYAQADKYFKMNNKEFNFAEYIKASNLREIKAKVQALGAGSAYVNTVYSELKSYIDKQAAKAARAEARTAKQKQKEFDESPEGKAKRAADEKKRKEREEAEARRVQGIKDAVNKAAGKISTPGQKAIVKVLTDALITSGATADNIEGNFLNRPGIASAIGGIMASDIHAIGATPQWFVDFIGLLDAELGINTNHLLSAATKAGVDIYGEGHTEKNAHGIGIDLAVQLPELINNAIAVFNDKATGDNPYMRDSGEGVVVLTKALNGKEPIVAIISPTTNNEGIVREMGEASNSREVNLYGKKDTVPINQVTTAYSVANFDSYIRKFAAKDPTALWADMQGIEALYNTLGKPVPDFFKNAPHEKENANRFSKADNANRLNLSEEDFDSLVKDIEKRLGKDEAKRVMQEIRKLQNQKQNAERNAQVAREKLKAEKINSRTEKRVAEKEIKSLTKERDQAVAERDKARKKKIEALNNANIALVWRVGMAESKGEMDLREALRIWKDKLGYATKTDKTWARGMVDSTRRNTKAAERKLAKEQRSLDHQINSLPAKAAVRTLNKYRNRSDEVVINDGQVVASPLPIKEEKSVLQKAVDFRKWVVKASGRIYRDMNNYAEEVDLMSKLQTRTDTASSWVNLVRGSKSTVQQCFEVGMVDRYGKLIGPALNKILMCYDEDGKVDLEMQKALEYYMFYKHTVDRMSLKSRALQKVKDFESLASNAWLTNLDEKEFALEVARGNEKAIEYARLIDEWINTKDKPVMSIKDETGKTVAVTAEIAQQIVDTYEKEMPELVKKAQSIYDWWDVFMRNWVVGTSITEEQYRQMQEVYPHYVPTYRKKHFGARPGGMNTTPSGLNPGSVIKGATGSLDELENMPDQFAKSLQKIVKADRQNSLNRNLIEEFMFDTDGIFSEYGVFDWNGASEALKQDLWDFADETDDTSIEKVKIDGQEAYKISCWVNGEKLSAYVNRAMYEGLSFLYDKHSDFYRIGVKVGNFITKPMKMAITGINMNFVVKNPIRDFQTALVNSIAGVAFPKYLALAAAKMSALDSDWITFQNLGGVSSEMHYNEKGFVAEEMSKGSIAYQVQSAKGIAKPFKAIKASGEKAIEALGKPGEATEAVTRFAEYLATLDLLGGDTFENRVAGIKNAAEVTVDFGRKGRVGAFINAWCPYWNPGLQGMDKMVRSVLEKEGLLGKIGQLLRAAAVNVLPKAFALLLTYLMGRWDDWKELSDQVKDNYILIPLKNEHKFLKLPISQDWGVYMGTTFLRIIEGVDGRDNKWENFYESALSSTLPFDLVEVGGVTIPVIMPIGLDWYTELIANKNYNGSAIVPYDLEDASPTEQWTSDTSQLAYLIAKALHASPIAIDYVLGDYFGNFYGVLLKMVPHGYFTGESTVHDKLQEAVSSLTSPWVADNRYSNAATASYYDLLDHLKQEVTDAKAHHTTEELDDLVNMVQTKGWDEIEQLAKYGDRQAKEALKLRNYIDHYEFYKALDSNGGYIDQLRELSAYARELPPGEEKDATRDLIAGLADEALEFYRAWENGDIEDPVHWATYHRYGEQIMNETAKLSKYANDFNFSGALGNPTLIYDRSGENDIKYRLDADQKKVYAAFRQENYREIMDQTINSREYLEADDKGKAARLEQAKTAALAQADKDMLEYLRNAGVQGETITKTDWDYERKAAAYDISRILGMDNAYSERVTDTLIDLYDYSDKYDFTPSESTRKTFNSLTNEDQVYILDSAQQKEYTSQYHQTYEDYMTKVINSSDFQSASDEERAVMLSLAKNYVAKEVNTNFNDWLERTGAESTSRDLATDAEVQGARYSVQRALGADNSYPAELTDELIRLYSYQGEFNFAPSDAKKEYFRSPTKDNTWYVLTEDQQAEYTRTYVENYTNYLLQVQSSSGYENLSEDEQARRLEQAKTYAANKTNEDFGKWMDKQTNVVTEIRESDKVADLAAKWDVQRVLGMENAIDEGVTSQLIDLYDLNSVGSQSFLPNITAPTSYTVVDSRGRQQKGQKWILNDEQRDMYTSLFYDTYEAEMLKVINSSTFARLDDYGKAMLLCATRAQVTVDTRNIFQQWLRDSHAPITYTNTPAAQQHNREIKEAQNTVEYLTK